MRTIIKPTTNKRGAFERQTDTGLTAPARRKEKTMRPIYIEGNRNGYSPEQCGRTLTVGELIEILESFGPERPVFLRNDRGYTYGSITEEDIEDAEEVSDDD